MILFDGQATEVCQITSGSGVIVQDEWMTIMFQYDASTNKMVLRKDGNIVAGPESCTQAPSDRNMTRMFVGRSNFENDAYLNGEIADFFVLDEIPIYLTRACDGDSQTSSSGTYKCVAVQSSTWSAQNGLQHFRDQGISGLGGQDGSALKAVDGDVGTCSLSWRESSPWWRVDLEAMRLVVSVRVYGRIDCCQAELNDFEIRVGNWPSWQDNPVCASNVSAPMDPRWVDVLCQATGRYLFIVLPGTNRSLALCEVNITGLSNAASNAISGLIPECLSCVPGILLS